MKFKVSEEWTEQRKYGNAYCKYAVRGFKRRLLGDLAVAVAVVFSFVLLLRWFFENKRLTKMKLMVTGEWMEKNDIGNAHVNKPSEASTNT